MVSVLTKQELRKLKVQELRDELIARGLDSSGTKPVLLGRLESAMDLTQIDVGKESGHNSTTDDGVDEALLAEVMKGDDANETELPDDKTVKDPSVSFEEADEAARDPEAISRHDQIVFLNEAGKDLGSAKSDDSAEIDKKKQRAKRFGLFDADLEEEKRKNRARRFGLPVAEDELLKLKTRAKRFGIPLPEDEEAKKKQRAERFGLSAMSGLSDEEKLRRRAERFKSG